MRVGCPCPPVRNDIVTKRHLFTKVTIIKSRLRIATYSYISIFVSSLYVICSGDRVSLSVLTELAFFTVLCNFCVVVSRHADIQIVERREAAPLGSV